MVIDQVLTNLYTCCKCDHQWTGEQDGPIPLNCPKCRNIRWNQKYRKEEIALIEQLIDQHTIKKDAEVVKIDKIEIRYHDLDFITYDFIFNIIPRPEMFEVKDILTIPKKNIEARHELMLSIIRDRITNVEKYTKGLFQKFGGWWWHHYDKFPSDNRIWYNYFSSRRFHYKPKTMKGCRHQEDPEIKNAFASEYKSIDLPKYLRPLVPSNILSIIEKNEKAWITKEKRRKEIAELT